MTNPRFAVLFVCLGNICRSPTAHGVFARKVEEAGLSEYISVDSAGTAAYHVGNPPDSRSSQFARKRGYDLSLLRARQALPEDFQRFDYILAMDGSNFQDLLAIRPASSQAELRLFLSFSKHHNGQDVPDPYYGGERGFEQVLDLVEAAAEGLLTDIRQKLGNVARFD